MGSTSAPVLAFVRESAGQRVLVAHNLSTAEAEAGPFDLPGATARALLESEGAGAPVRGEGGWRVRLPAGGSGVWVLEP